MIIQIDMAADIPIYQQIRNQIVLGVATGQMKAGDPLPTVRQLAGEIGINPMTVSKAYGLLKGEGVISMDRRNGAQIHSLPVEGDAMDLDFDQRLTLLISEARIKGASGQELKERMIQLMNRVYEMKEVLS
ncbi:GntR family transcriptional regulator [Eubacteriales bacterium mix99]